MTEAQQIIARLGLQPLQPEGGFFARTWTSSGPLAAQRPALSAIYFLITPAEFSALHRLDADELWHFYAGDPVEHLQLTPGGPGRLTILGANVLAGQFPQLVVPRGVWQGARNAPPQPAPHTARGWSLLGCTMTPGWRNGGFELGNREALSHEFPAWEALIHRLYRPSPNAAQPSSGL